MRDEDGKEIFNYTPEKDFGNVVISIPEISIGKTYILKCGEFSQEISISSVIYGSSGGIMGGHGGFRG